MRNFCFIGKLWTKTFLKQGSDLIFGKDGVRFSYENGSSWIGFGEFPFFQSASPDSGRGSEILLLRGDGSALSLSDGSLSMLGVSCPFGRDCGTSLGGG
jgi:hypothetical protein